MPIVLDPNNSGMQSSLTSYDYGYTYPNGDMRPDSELSRRICTEVLKRARTARRAMEPKFDAWRKLDEILTVYITPDEKELAVQKQDSRKPISLVVPISFAVLDALLAFNTASMAQLPYYRYTGIGAANQVKALLQERCLQVQSIKAKHLLGHHTLWRDMFVYGFGAMVPEWFTRYGFKDKATQYMQTDQFTGQQTMIEGPKQRTQIVRFEGHRLVVWDPYNTLPDPNVSIEDVERMEFIGNVWRDSRVGLLSAEQTPNSGLINCQYLKHLGTSGISTLLDRSRQAAAPDNAEGTFPVDVIGMFISLVPKEWKLGPSEYPEKWVFWVAADRIVIKAMPLGTNHNMFPVVVAAPDYNGHTPLCTSRMELVYPLQHYENYVLNNHITNQRKFINDRLVVDPSIINMKDLMNSTPGGIVRLNKPVWGKGVKDGIMQLTATDVTRQNMPDIAMASDLIYRITGATDAMQGVVRQSGERVTATEVQGTRTTALGRVQHAFKIAHVQYMNDLSDILASQTQQYMSQDVELEINGRYREILQKEFGVDQEHVMAGPGQHDAQDFTDCDYDVIPYEDFMPGGENTQVLAQMMQPMLNQPQVIAGILQKVDMSRVFQHILRSNGVNSWDSFEYSQQEQEKMAQEAAQQQQQAVQQQQMMMAQQQEQEQLGLQQQQALELHHQLALEAVKRGAQVQISDNERVIAEKERGNLVPA